MAANINDIEITLLDGTPTTMGQWGDKVRLIVNVASRCGLAPQYAQLEALQKQYGERGFTVIGCPSNQFLQELGSQEKIAEYCSTTWGVTFPMTEKLKVNGKNRHPLYQELTQVTDAEGNAGNVKWNFEKFVIAPDGTAYRFRPMTNPDAPAVIAAIEAHLPG